MKVTTRKRELQDLMELLAEQIRKGVRSPEEAKDALPRELRARPRIARLRERIARRIMP